jgi:hypothetical protein
MGNKVPNFGCSKVATMLIPEIRQPSTNLNVAAERGIEAFGSDDIQVVMYICNVYNVYM